MGAGLYLNHPSGGPFLKDQIELCEETGKFILPVSVDETASQKIYRKHPKSEKNIIKGMNSSGVNELFATGDMLSTVLKDVFTDVNIYDDDIRLLQYPFISPISSSDAISFYKYYIMDTTYVDKDRCFHLTFVPNNSQDFGFTGHLYVLADSSYTVKKCTMNLPKRKVSVKPASRSFVIFSRSSSENPAFFRLVFGFFKSISSCATFKSPQRMTGLDPSSLFK